jgi:peptidoglycan hydrolase CwlO-like protein
MIFNKHKDDNIRLEEKCSNLEYQIEKLEYQLKEKDRENRELVTKLSFRECEIARRNEATASIREERECEKNR